MSLLKHLHHPARRLQLLFALVALVLVTLAWRSHTLFGIDPLLYFPVSQLCVAISLGLATIGPTTGITVRKTSRVYFYVLRVAVVIIAASSLYVLRVNVIRWKQAKQSQGPLQSPLVQAIQQNDLKMVAQLIEAGESVLSRDVLDMSPLDYACGAIPRADNQPSGSLKSAELLLKLGADVNGAGKYGRTPLMYAVRSHNPELIRFLIKNGADMNRTSRDGHSALFYAQLDGNHDVVKLLKEKGANSEGPGESRSPASLLNPK